MSIGGHSLHKGDWLKLGGAAALAGTGPGAAGIGPLAGLLGGSSAAAGDAMLPGALMDTSTLAGGLGAGAADEAIGSGAAGAANPFSIDMSNLLTQLKPSGNTMDVLKALQKAGSATQQIGGQQQQPHMASMGQFKSPQITPVNPYAMPQGASPIAPIGQSNLAGIDPELLRKLLAGGQLG